MIATILGVPFGSFALTIAIGKSVAGCDRHGVCCCRFPGVLFLAAPSVFMFAGSLAAGPGIYTVLYIAAVITGIGWGLVETVVNPHDGNAVSGRQDH